MGVKNNEKITRLPVAVWS